MMSNQEIKEYAKKEYKNKFGDIFLPVIISTFATSAVSGVAGFAGGVFPLIGFIIGIAIGVVTYTLQIGLYDYLVKYITGKTYKLDDLFGRFNEIGKLFPIYILQTVFIFLWSLLLIVPGIIKAISYSLVPFLYLDNPDKEAPELLKLSEDMMNGHKMDLFMLYLSFIPYHLLGIITCGLFEFYVMPLQTLATTKFLLEVKDSQKGSSKKEEIKDAEVVEDNNKKEKDAE